MSIEQFCKDHEHVFKALGYILPAGTFSGLLFYLRKQLGALIVGVAGWFRKLSLSHPRINCVQNLTDTQQSFWFKGRFDNQPKLHVRGRYHLTLYGWDYPPSFIKSVFKPTKEVGQVLLEEVSELSGFYTVSADKRYLTNENVNDLIVEFWLTPGIEEEGKPLVGEILLVDQYGNEHNLGVQSFYSHSG